LGVSRTEGKTAPLAPGLHGKANTQTIECPRCGSELVMRMAKRGANAGNRFVGCSSFPKCRFTQNLGEPLS